MPLGETHDKIGLTVAAVATGAALYYGYPIEAAAVLGASIAFGTLMFSPDLDSESTPKKRWRKIGLGWLWEPYDYFIAHRSPLSHYPVLGTVGRLLYFSLGVSLLLFVGGFVFDLATAVLPVLLVRVYVSAMQGLSVVDAVWGTVWTWGGENPALAIAVIAGQEISSLAHIIPDRLATAIKRRV